MEPLKVSLADLKVGDYLPLLKASVIQKQTIRWGRGRGVIRTINYALSDGRFLLSHNAALLYRDAQGKLRNVLQRPRIIGLVEVIRLPMESDSKET